MIGADNPKRPPLSVIMVYPHRMLLKGPLPGYIRRCEDVGVGMCVCVCMYICVSKTDLKKLVFDEVVVLVLSPGG